QTTRNIATNTTEVEGTHRQLGTRLTNGLGSHDPDCLADLDLLTRGHGLPVAGGAHASGGATGHDGASLDGLHASLDQLCQLQLADDRTGRADDLAVRADGVGGQEAAQHGGLDEVRASELAGLLAVGVQHRGADVQNNALLGATVVLADDDVVRDVHQTTGEVTGVRGTQCRIRQALTGTVGVVEVLEHGQALAEGGLHRTGDVVTAGVRDHALHAGQGPDLAHVTGSTGLHDHRDRVIIRVELLHRFTDEVRCFLPQVNQGLVSLGLVDLASGQLLLDALSLGLVLVEDLLLIRQDQHVVHGDGHTGAGCPVEASVLQLVHRLRDGDHRVLRCQVVNDDGLVLLVHHAFDVRVVPRQQLVELHAAQGGLGGPGLALLPTIRELLRLDLSRRAEVVDADVDRGLQAEHTTVVGHDGLCQGGVHAGCRALLGGLGEGTLAAELLLTLDQGQVVEAGDHVQTRHSQRLTGRRGQDVVGSQHQDAGLSLGLVGQRQVNCHLVTIEVRVEGLTGQRVQLNSLTLNQHGLEGLDTQAVQRWCTVQHHRVLGDGLFQNVPDLGALALNHALRGLDVLRIGLLHQALHHERLEQLQGHQLRQTTLVQLQLRTNDNHRTARVVQTLAQQVLAESALLTIQQGGEGLQRGAARAGDRTTATAVVEQRVHRLLQHALLVVHDDLRSTEIQHALQAVVAVDDAAVQVVEVGGREAATVQLNHRAQLRRDDRDAVQDHAGRVVAGAQERSDNLQPLQGAQLALTLAVADDLTQGLGLCFEVEVADQGLDSLRAHATGEVVLVA